MGSRLPADWLDPQEKPQFTLGQLLEAMGWAAFIFAYIGYLAHRSLRPEDASLPLVLSPMMLLGGLGGLVGCLRGARWYCVICGLLVGAAPLLLALSLVLLVKR
jgi:hypothetical protein